MALMGRALPWPLAIVHVGACTPLGLNAEQTGFLYRTGAIGMRESAILDAKERPVTVCALPTLDPYLVGPARLFALVDRALRDFQSDVRDRYAELRVKLVVLLDENFARALPGGQHRADMVGSEIKERTRKLLGIQPRLQTLTADTAGLSAALPKLGAELQQGEYDVTIVLGVHSDYDPERIKALDDRGRLFSQEQRDALVPGEAAAICSLATPLSARRQRWPIRAELLSAAAGLENATIDNDESAFEAGALTAALRKAHRESGIDAARIGWLLSDISQETFRLHEFQAVLARTQNLFGPPAAYDQPAQLFGHLGAATLPLHFVLCAQAWRHGYAPHGLAVSLAGSDSGPRSAVVLSRAR